MINGIELNNWYLFNKEKGRMNRKMYQFRCWRASTTQPRARTPSGCFVELNRLRVSYVTVFCTQSRQCVWPSFPLATMHCSTVSVHPVPSSVWAGIQKSTSINDHYAPTEVAGPWWGQILGIVKGIIKLHIVRSTRLNLPIKQPFLVTFSSVSSAACDFFFFFFFP